MAGQRPYEPNDPPRQPTFKLPKETDAMPEQAKQPTHEQLRQQQNQQPQQPSQSGGNIQNILAYFASQGVQDDHIVATIGGFPLKLSELKQATQPQQNHPLPSPPKTEHKQNEEHRKRPSKSEENDS